MSCRSYCCIIDVGTAPGRGFTSQFKRILASYECAFTLVVVLTGTVFFKDVLHPSEGVGLRLSGSD